MSERFTFFVVQGATGWNATFHGQAGAVLGVALGCETKIAAMAEAFNRVARSQFSDLIIGEPLSIPEEAGPGQLSVLKKGAP